MPIQSRSNDIVTIAIAVLIVVGGLFILSRILNLVSNNIGTVVALAALGLVGSIALFYAAGNKAK
jgi:divalent metal cation (Fe/Co/Zn/Cd) transporter